ncbi:MAG TPA: T9SS type A sorting domain-containing protein, partial [Chitinophagaceae bacterium]|nr:T9SS type A sorting domain-containing protein [Chitinophagaceae bacterium]
STVSGTVNSATASAGIPTSCTGPAAYDVWYKFTAINANETITTSGFGTGFGGTQRMELYSGTCGSLTSLACGTTSIAATTLTPGSTYYVRVYTTTGPAPTAFGDFKICVSTTNAPPRIGNSYVNLSKNKTGGVVQKGDTLEIRMTLSLTSGTLYSTRYLDNVPTNTKMLAGSADSIRIITNEGLTYHNYTATDNTNDDPGTYKSAPGAGEYNVRLNLGQGSGNWPTAPANNTTTDITGAGNLPSTANPRGGGGMLFATSFRVVVTGNVGDTITLNGGQFIYRTSLGGTDLTLSGTPYKILITDPLTLCSNSVGVNNAVEYGGTFGSGTTLNRTTDLATPISGYTFVAASSTQAIGDGQYAIVNNTSPISGTNKNANRQPTCPTTVSPDLLCSNRMFSGYWYIAGDHSGTNTSTGNAPVASGTNGGYMLAVNADYVASEAYRQTLTGLCPNTYYEFSAWIQNICPTCGADSLGQQFKGTSTAPANGYPGVYPNLTFSLDGVDRYSTGQVDTLGWEKKGFIFLTGPSQTTATLSIRNNAQGGGGNDWVMDDISIATCFPSMRYSPTSTPNVCKNNSLQIGDTVSSVFNNYTYYVWQRSTDHGVTWSNITSTQTATPVLQGTQYVYITTFNVPATNTNLSDSGDIYRVYTATTSSNLTNSSCIANDGSAPISLTVLDCGVVLKSDLLSFNGNLQNNLATLSWTTSKEDVPVHFLVERSNDGIHFSSVGTVNGHNNVSLEINYYSFVDPALVTDSKWYRIVMVDDQGSKKYSRVVQLTSNLVEFSLSNVINPFNSELHFEVTTSKSQRINVDLVDMQGRTVKTTSYLVYTGVNSLNLTNTDALTPGVYSIIVRHDEKLLSRRVVKQNN